MKRSVRHFPNSFGYGKGFLFLALLPVLATITGCGMEATGGQDGFETGAQQPPGIGDRDGSVPGAQQPPGTGDRDGSVPGAQQPPGTGDPDGSDPEVQRPSDPESFSGSDWEWVGTEARPKEIASEESGYGVGAAGSGGMAPAAAGTGGAGGSAAGSAGWGADSATGDAVIGGASSAGTSGGIETGTSTCGSDCAPPEFPAGQLTAAEWNDLDNWDFFRALMESENQRGESWGGMEELWGFYTAGRIEVEVVDGDEPVENAKVVLLDDAQQELWQARTDAYGQAQLYPGMFSAYGGGELTVRVEHGEAETELSLPSEQVEAPHVIELQSTREVPLALDLMFMIDTTGSMGDELSYIQSELDDVIRRVEEATVQQLDPRLSVNFYRDLGDLYVVRSFPFTSKISDATEALAQQSANGGGDFPEAVDLALEIAVDQHDWNPYATTRLLFLVLDAPPHQQPDIIARVQQKTQKAAAFGIQIIPVSASGIDKETEFLLRFLAVTTNGTYVFLTDDSGIGNAHLQAEPTIGSHQIELLNDLLVRVITERLGL